jgi:hypothetical protein
MRDVMERLAAADPFPDAERLTADERREADAMLAGLRADAPGDAVDAPRRHRAPGRWALAAATGACLAIAAFVAVDLIDSDAPGPDVVERAVAAVTQEDSIYHTIERTRVRGSDGLRDDVYVESWHASDGARHSRYYDLDGSRRGALRGEEALPPPRPLPSGKIGGTAVMYDARRNAIRRARFVRSERRGVPELDPAEDPGAALEALEREGQLRLAGTTSVGGKRAYRLVSKTVPGFAPGTRDRIEYVVDAETYVPLALTFTTRSRGGTLEVSIRYLEYERLPLNARTRELLDLDPHPDARRLPDGAGVGRERQRSP